MNKQSKFEEEFSTVLSNIAYSAVTEQKLNTIKYYKIPLLYDEHIIAGIRKDKNKYKISVGYYERIVKRSNIEAIEIVMALIGMIKQNVKTIST